MHFYLTKLAWFLIQPFDVIAFCLALGAVFLLFNKDRWGRKLVILGAVLYLGLGYLPVGNLLLVPLEDANPKPTLDDLQQISGIIVLGGAIDTLISRHRIEPQFNEAGERMMEAVRMAKLFPSLPLIFSGGNTEILFDEDSESDVARRFFASFDLKEPQLKFENRSRNTAENAKFTAELIHPTPGQRWLLITSAFHMTRAKALFEAQGFTILPWPVDYRTRGPLDRYRFSTSPDDGLHRVDLAMKEQVSYYYSWIRGDLAPRN